MTTKSSKDKPEERWDIFAHVTRAQWHEAVLLSGGSAGAGVCIALDKCIAMREAENPWRERLIDALATAGIYSNVHESDPRQAIHDLIAWEVAIALDPAVSSEAQALVQRGIDSVKGKS